MVCVILSVKSNLRKLVIWYSLYSFLDQMVGMLLSSTTSSCTNAAVANGC